MSKDQSIDSIFCAAIEIVSEADRAAYVDEACGDDTEVRNRVNKLLAAHAKAGSFMAESEESAETIDRSSGAEQPGTMIGPYKLLQQIGEGGFGVVYMAEQEKPIQRRVALKVIKPGMDSKQVIARFEAERQALALMDHQNIARVFDAGTTETGRPYFVMELVKGVPITEYCDKNKLTLEQRLNLFCQVCNAVQHAHQKGIIHRDIKPSNVMVTLYDGKPVPKVIDFGVSKAIQQKLTERTLFTAYGNLIGTPEYMSPEQAEMSGLDVDTRTDVYALGVLLYELLTGTTPITREELNKAGFDEMLRTIREVEPPRPSIRLSQSGEALASISEHRRVEPGKLSRFVRGDLDWIVMKALEKDRTRRYETSNALASDVKRYLEHEAVEASPPSTVYKLRKFAKKNRNAVAIASAFGALLLLCTVVSMWLAIRFLHERDLANTRGEQAERAQQNEAAAHAETALQLERAQIERLALRAMVTKEKSSHQAIHMAVKAVERSRDRLGHVIPSAYESLTTVIGASCGQLVASDASGPDAIAFSSNGQLVAVGSDDSVIRLIEFDGGELRESIEVETEGGIRGLAFTPDGKWLIAGGNHGFMRLWIVDAMLGASAEPDLTLRSRIHPIPNIAVSPDSRWLASQCDKGVMGLWDLTSDDIERSSIEFSPDDDPVLGPIRCFGFSHDSRWWAIGCSLGKVLLIDLKSGAPGNRHRLDHGSDEDVKFVEFTPDGTQLITAGNDGVLRVWDITASDPAIAPVKTIDSHDEVTSVALSRDNRRLAVGGRHGVIRIWDFDRGETTSPKTVLRPAKYGNAINSLAFVRDGQLLVAAGQDFAPRIWDLSLAEPEGREYELLGHADISEVKLHVSHDGNWLATACSDQTIRMWDLRAVDPADSYPGRMSPIGVDRDYLWRMEISPNGRWLVVGHVDGAVLAWDLAEHEYAPPLSLRASGHLASSLSFTSDSEWFYWSDANGVVRGVHFLSDDGPTEAVEIADVGRLIRNISPSSDGHWLYIGCHDGTVLRLDLHTPTTEPLRLGTMESVSALEMSFNGDWLFALDSSGEVRRWSLTADDPAVTERSLGRVEGGFWSRLAIDPQDRWLFHGSRSGDILGFPLNAVELRQPDLRLVGHKARVASMQFTPDGNTLVSSGWDGAARLWDLTSEDPGASCRTVTGHDFRLMVVTPDGRYLFSGGGLELSPRRWDLDLDAMLDVARARAGRKLTDNKRQRFGLDKRATSSP